MKMAKTHSFLIKTKGWLLTAGTLADIEAQADFSTFCANGTFAWAETQKIELTGLAIEGEVAFPQGWSVQEMTIPEGYCYGLLNVTFNPSSPQAPNNLPFYCEIHDFWTTKPFTLGTFTDVIGRVISQRYGPAMQGYAQVPAQSPKFNWEQVIACRSRMWAPPINNAFDYGRQTIHASARQQFNFKIHDNQWGSGEPIACLDLHHTRVYIANTDTASPEVIDPTTGSYADMPPSLQPMLVVVDEPPFLSRMTMERRSKGI